MSSQKPIFSELDNWSVPHALDALKKRDGTAFGGAAGSSGRNLGLVFDNMDLLMKRGMYEAALLSAFISCKTNYHHWDHSVIKWMFDEADRRKLNSLGFGIPNVHIIAYRGVSGVGKKRHIHGISWTTSKDMACWFAMRFAHLGNPTVLKCVFDPKDIYVFHNEREEDELIGLPQKPVNSKLTIAQMNEGFSRTVERRQQRWLEKYGKVA